MNEQVALSPGQGWTVRGTVHLLMVWRAEALADLKSIVEYIADRNVAAAIRLHSAIEACAERLRQRPHVYRLGRVEGTRGKSVTVYISEAWRPAQGKRILSPFAPDARHVAGIRRPS